MKEEIQPRLYNFFLISILYFKGHKYSKIEPPTKYDKKSYFYFPSSERIEDDIQAYYDDKPILIRPRTLERIYKDIKHMANNVGLFKSDI